MKWNTYFYLSSPSFCNTFALKECFSVFYKFCGSVGTIVTFEGFNLFWLLRNYLNYLNYSSSERLSIVRVSSVVHTLVPEFLCFKAYAEGHRVMKLYHLNNTINVYCFLFSFFLSLIEFLSILSCFTGWCLLDDSRTPTSSCAFPDCSQARESHFGSSFPFHCMSSARVPGIGEHLILIYSLIYGLLVMV